ncbi:MAG: hypothetical protein QW372_01765 [Nitrososphaerales archaeon]
MSEDGHPKWGFGETVRQKCKEKREKAKKMKNLDDIIEWLEALEERIKFLEARL